jgi:hypothetical protein
MADRIVLLPENWSVISISTDIVTYFHDFDLLSFVPFAFSKLVFDFCSIPESDRHFHQQLPMDSIYSLPRNLEV